MQVNSIQNQTNFGNVYKVKVSAADVAKFEQNVANSYKKANGAIKGVFVRSERANKKGAEKVSHTLYVMTGKDVAEFSNSPLKSGLWTTGDDIFANTIFPNVPMIKTLEENFLKNKTVENVETLDGLKLKLLV